MDLCSGVRYHRFIRVRPAVFIRLTQTKVWLCEGWALHRTGSTVLVCVDKMAPPKGYTTQFFPAFTGPSGKSSAPGDQAGHIRLTTLRSTSSAGQVHQEIGEWS